MPLKRCSKVVDSSIQCCVEISSLCNIGGADPEIALRLSNLNVVGNKVARIPLGDVSLELPEGLSEYMDSGLGIAEVFEYSADWTLVGDNLCEIM